MTTAYTSLLGLALPVTGELSGTWGDTVNDYITQYLDASVAGTQTISGSQTAVTLSKTTNASLSQAGSGATGSSQYNVINCTGNPASMLTVTVPAASKTYVVVNATSTNQDVKIVGAGPTTGVTLVAGEKAIIAWNGSDFIKVATSTVDGVSTIAFGTTGLTPSSATSGAVTVAGTLVAANGGTGQSSYTTGDLLYATGSTALSKLGIGASGNYLSSSGTAPQWSAPAALTKTDDTNVTLTLGGSASTALLNAASLTLGWTGQLSVARGGTNATATPTAGAVAYGTGTAYAFSAAGSSGQVLTSGGTGAPTWSTLSGVAVTTFSAGTTGFTPSSATSGAVTLAGTLATTNGGTGLTSFTANRVFYSSSTSAIGSSANLTFDGTTLTANALTTTSTVTINGGTANGVAYLNGSKVLTTGSALSFDGTNFATTGTITSGGSYNFNTTSGRDILWGTGSYTYITGNPTSGVMAFGIASTELMRLNSTGLGIGTSTVASKLAIAGFSSANITPDINITRSSSGTTIQSGPNITFADGTTNNTVTLQATQGRFGVWNYGAGSWIERLSVTSAGDVGIGTSSPASKLDVVGAARLTADGASVSLYTGAGWRHTGSAGLYIDANSGGAANSVFIRNGSGFTTQLTLDGSGNLGLGVTPYAWSSSYYGLDAGNTALYAIRNVSSGGGVSANSFINASSNWIYKTSDFAARYDQQAGRHAWFTAPSGTAGNAISFTQAMTLTQGGNLLLGTTTGSGARIDSQGSVAGVLEVFNGQNTSLDVAAITRLTLASQGGNWYIENQRIGAPLCFNRNGTELARITSGGQFLVGTTTNTNTSSIVANGTISETVGGTQYLVVSQADIGTAANEIPLNQYLGALAYVDTETPALAVGSGITGGTGTICKVNGGLSGGIYRVTILIDLTGLNSGGTANDIIGVNGTANPCFIALLPAITVLGGRMTCLETPAGGDTDIDLYSAVEGTGVEDQAITALTETLIINAGAQTTGTVTYFSADPGANTYLYLCGQGTANATYTAGRFLIEIFGVQ